MRRTLVSSLLLVLGAFVVATSGAGISVAHGSAHLHAAEHDLPQAGAEQRPAALEHSASATSDESEHGAHPHLLFGAAVTTRSAAQLFVVTAQVALALPTGTSYSATTPGAGQMDVPDEPPPDRAAQPRAPPLG